MHILWQSEPNAPSPFPPYRFRRVPDANGHARAALPRLMALTGEGRLLRAAHSDSAGLRSLLADRSALPRYRPRRTWPFRIRYANLGARFFAAEIRVEASTDVAGRLHAGLPVSSAAWT